ncbi:MAG TPA: hypothetical protein VKB86_08335, partial [Pyrinomonadaceae bacterium]|nr:hypothetical protein [Pyrinomonadaceae bacterium]
MNHQNEEHELQVKKTFSDVLNRHGYGFQYSVLNLANKLFIARNSSWLFQAVEFPVEVKGYSTRIDFILKRKSEPTFFLLAECKRANPALSNWCFVRAPYIHRNHSDGYEPVIMEHAQSGYAASVTAYAKERPSAYNPCHIGLEVRSNAKGDTQGESGKAIEDAASQVLRGLNGMVELLSKNRHILSNWKRADFLPVIFTTAQLWLSNAELSSADIQTGKVDLTNSTFT